MKYQNDRSSMNSKIFGRDVQCIHSDSHVVGERLLVPISHKVSDFRCFAPTRREPLALGKQLVNFITCDCESSASFYVIYKAGREPTLYW